MCSNGMVVIPLKGGYGGALYASFIPQVCRALVHGFCPESRASHSVPFNRVLPVHVWPHRCRHARIIWWPLRRVAAPCVRRRCLASPSTVVRMAALTTFHGPGQAGRRAARTSNSTGRTLDSFIQQGSVVFCTIVVGSTILLGGYRYASESAAGQGRPSWRLLQHSTEWRAPMPVLEGW